jgi:FKBP-type peptidyl-prolyl cis-trans isomerase SlyD
MKFMGLLVGGMILTIAVPTIAFAAQTVAKEEKVIKNGSFVSLQYTLSGEDGKLIESSKGKAPLKYIHGANQIIPGLEKELTGMKVGEQKRVTVKPQDAYGLVDPNAFQEFPKEQIPSNGLKVGAVLATQGPRGETVAARVHQIKEKTVVIDMNHPMAGRTLIFEIKIVEIQSSPPPQPRPPAQPAAPAQPAKPAKPAAPK